MHTMKAKLLILWTVFISVHCTYSSEPYEVESHYHRNWLVVNLTCAGTENNQMTKRSMASYNDFKNEVSHDEFRSFQDSLNSSEYLTSGFVNTNESKSEKDGDKLRSERENSTESLFATSPNLTESANNGTSSHRESDDKYNHTEKTLIAINCDYLELNSEVINPSVKYLKLRPTGTLKLGPNWAHNLSDLVVLKINADNGLHIPIDCSWVPPFVSHLDLAYTKLLLLSLGKDCPSSLKKLYLQGASLTNLTLCNPSLEEIDASWNFLSGDGVTLGCQDSAATPHVKSLQLHNNELTSWSSCGWPSLTHLELQKNNIRSLNFSCPSPLVYINLSNNKLQELPHNYPPKLTSIHLSHNHIKKMTHFHRAIQDIDLSHNSLTVIGKGTFRSASHLLSLDLSHNKISVIYGHDFSGLNSLRYLDLSRNVITHIRHEAFHPMRYILGLRIDNNNLHQLDARVFSNLPRNVNFRGHDNPWRCSCHLLASLNKVSTQYCKPNCYEVPELTCVEGKSVVRAQHVLQQCIEAVQEFNTVSPVQLLPNKQSSDEDTSEEKIEASSTYYMIIPTIALVIGIPLVVLGVRKMYLNRKRIKRMCHCLAPSVVNSSNNGFSSTRHPMNRESDSETEF